MGEEKRRKGGREGGEREKLVSHKAKLVVFYDIILCSFIFGKL